jgi:hypothetical protein
MNIKIIGTIVCALFLLGAISGAVNTNNINKTDIKSKNYYQTGVFTTPTTTVWLKFFIHDECTKNISQMVADCNDIYNGGDEGSRNGVGITQFGTNGTVTTLSDDDFDNCSTTAGQVRLLRHLKANVTNCSNGINIVIAPDGLFTSNGLTYFNKGTGTNDKTYGGIILRDTCNQDQMNDTLAHELLHALGLSHEQVKWVNPDTGEIESKPIGSTIVNGSGPGSDRAISAGSSGYPVPPHGYAYYDKDGDCKCDDNGDEQPENDAGRKIWDIDGNCEFGDANDTGSLLWGRADRTNTNMSEEQKKEIFDNANNTPGYRLQNVTEEVPVPQKEKTKSKGFFDKLKDVGKKFIDILGGLVNKFYDHKYIYFGLELNGLIPEGTSANYYYYIDKDNDLTTGDPLGFDYLIDLLVRPEYIVSALSEWDPYNGMFLEVSELDWNIAQGIQDSEDDEDCNELEIGDTVLQWNVPMDLLDLGETGSMRIMAVATDGLERETDMSPEIIISKERVIVPVLNLNPFSGNPGDTITCNGYDYTPNSEIKIEFNCQHLVTTTTDGNGDFTTTFTVPSKTQGYYTVNAYDLEGKFHIRLFYVNNQPPNKPSTPTGQTSGKAGNEYEYESTASDPNGDQIYYWFDWGDDSNSGWIGPYTSGQKGSAKHTWSGQGDYQIKVKSKDSNNAESVWSDPLDVTMPKNKAFSYNYNLLKWFFEHLPNAFKIIQYIFN